MEDRRATLSAIRLLERLATRPVLTLPAAIELLDTTRPTAGKAIDTLQQAGIPRETTGRQRDRVYAYDAYLQVLTRDTD